MPQAPSLGPFPTGRPYSPAFGLALCFPLGGISNPLPQKEEEEKEQEKEEKQFKPQCIEKTTQSHDTIRLKGANYLLQRLRQTTTLRLGVGARFFRPEFCFGLTVTAMSDPSRNLLKLLDHSPIGWHKHFYTAPKMAYNAFNHGWQGYSAVFLPFGWHGYNVARVHLKGCSFGWQGYSVAGAPERVLLPLNGWHGYSAARLHLRAILSFCLA